MHLLVIDTALEACAVGAVADGRQVLRSETVGRGHAERLMGMIAGAMAEAGLTFPELDRIAVTVGPGSFTGLRVGIAAARGLALVTGCAAVGIGTLAVHAEAARHEIGPAPVLALQAAGRGEVYGQSFDEDGLAAEPVAVGLPEIFARRIAANTMLAGSGADALAAVIGAEAAARTVHRHAVPDLAALCRLGLAAPPPSEPPRPLYVRPPDARPQTAGRIARR